MRMPDRNAVFIGLFALSLLILVVFFPVADSDYVEVIWKFILMCAILRFVVRPLLDKFWPDK